MLRLAVHILLILLVGYIAAPILARAQVAPTSPPLFRFFQQNFDSTLVYENSGWLDAPDLLILAKQGREVYFFTYRSPYTYSQEDFIPGGLAHYFNEQEARFRTTIPDTNRYLLLPEVNVRNLAQIWQTLHPTQLWKVRDADPHPTGQICGVDDAETSILHFLTRTSARSASFYAPDFYEECEGKGFNRGQVIRTRNTLQNLLKR
ncbi:hypothetical protein [Hymenobacter sp. UYP22]|uniref:hypothetical protein n=1 Tax=Hymenobacter sp. UYP22 TaxID=3156348 RepID=UPI0033918B38